MNNSWFQESKNDSDILGIAFSSSMINFEWLNTLECELRSLNFNKLYIKDNWGCWWHSVYEGCKGYGVHILKDFINDKINEYGSKRIFTIGASKGGYGALLLGCLLNVDSVFSFSPKTFLNKAIHKKYKILDRVEEVKSVYPDFTIDYSMSDLKDIFSKYGSNNKTNYKIFYGLQNIGDSQHINNLSSFKGIELISLKTATHKTASIVSKDGTVKKLIKEFIGDT